MATRGRARRAATMPAPTPAEVDAVILATATPDQAFPATALRVQAALGIGGFGFDLSAACSGFIYALSIADAMIRAGQVRGVLVIGSEVYSRILNWQDRGTCVLFGDGAGAVFLRAGAGPATAAGRGILSTHLHAEGTLGDILYVDGAVGRPDRPGHLRDERPRGVPPRRRPGWPRRWTRRWPPTAWPARDVDWLVPHQANVRIIDAIGRKLGLPPERVVVTVDRHANTSAASIPLALAEAYARRPDPARPAGAAGGARRRADLGVGAGPAL